MCSAAFAKKIRRVTRLSRGQDWMVLSRRNLWRTSLVWQRGPWAHTGDSERFWDCPKGRNTASLDWKEQGQDKMREACHSPNLQAQNELLELPGCTCVLTAGKRRKNWGQCLMGHAQGCGHHVVNYMLCILVLLQLCFSDILFWSVTWSFTHPVVKWQKVIHSTVTCMNVSVGSHSVLFKKSSSPGVSRLLR